MTGLRSRGATRAITAPRRHVARRAFGQALFLLLLTASGVSCGIKGRPRPPEPAARAPRGDEGPQATDRGAGPTLDESGATVATSSGSTSGESPR